MEIQDNASKAREIGKVNARQYRHNYGGNEFVFSDNECTQSALEMAEWKDQQLKEYLEKKRTDFPDFMAGDDAYAFGMKEGYVTAFDKIINELFPND